MEIKKVVVIGSGTMGSGIAAHLCNANIPVTLLDLTTEISTNARDRIYKSRPPLLIDRSKIDNIKVGNFTFDFDGQTLTLGDNVQKLTTKEAKLLLMFCENRFDVLDRNLALNKVWGDDNYYNSRSMDVYIAKLRKYLTLDPEVELVNVHGKGFKLLAKED